MDPSELSVELAVETWTYPSLGVIVSVGAVDGGDPFVIEQEVCAGG